MTMHKVLIVDDDAQIRLGLNARIEAGAAAFFQKPVENDELLQALASVLS